MNVAELIQLLRNNPNDIIFQNVIDAIDAHYSYTPTSFHNGIGDDYVVNTAGTNEGSCRVFSFAQLNGLNESETLACFGQHYRSVLNTPQGSDHANIRTFMRHGWKGIKFNGIALTTEK